MQFPCTHAGCSRAYLRKEHLKRHMKSHERPKEFTCRECGARLSRMDTFRRHMALHGSDLPSVRVAQACLPCRRAKMKCDGQQPTCSGCSTKSLPCAWPVLTKGRNRHLEPSASIVPDNAPVSPDPSSMEYPGDLECEGINDLYDLYGLTPHVQNSVALVAQAECPGKLAMYDQLIAFYFDKFHHHWPILHEESIRLRRVPQVLLKTVVTIGLYLTGNSEAKKMANDTLERFLHHSGNTLASYVTLGEAGQLFPEPEHLFEFQAILLQAIMIPRLTGEGLATGIMIDSMLSRALMLAGVYDQNRIDTASSLSGGNNVDPAILRESYQRLALFHFKFHALFQVFCRSKFPWNKISGLIDPLGLRVKLPVLPEDWDRQPVFVQGAGATDSGELPVASSGQLISDMCQMAIMTGDKKSLDPVDAIQPGLGTTLWVWLTRTSDDDPDFVGHVKEVGLNSFRDVPASVSN